MLQKRYLTLKDLNEYAKEKHINQEELRIFICRDIPELQKEDSKLPIYAKIDKSNDLRIVVDNTQWAFAKQGGKIPVKE